MSEDYIVAKDLLAGWQESRAVCKIDELHLAKQNITVLCGPNGAGKSTLLKTIAGQIRPLSGEISIDGQKQSSMSRVQIAQRVAYVPQFVETRRSLSVAEWVALGRNPHQQWWNWSASKTDREKISEALERTSCAELRDKLIDNLSGGERQRVLIATALAQEPHFMLLDEPTAHLDFRHQIELSELLMQLKQEGIGILVVMHDLNLTANLGDRVILLKRVAGGAGEVAAAGTVSDVLTADKLKEVYGVSMEILKNSDGSVVSYIATSLAN